MSFLQSCNLAVGALQLPLPTLNQIGSSTEKRQASLGIVERRSPDQALSRAGKSSGGALQRSES